MCEAQSKDKETFELVKNFFSLENVGIKHYENSRSVEDKLAMEILESTTTRRDDKWETGLLWSKSNPVMPDSKPMALKRLHSMERKMDNNPERADLCVKRFEEYVRKGYLKKVISGSGDVDVSRKWTLPWFFAYHPSKKPRLVFDAAAKVDGKSFNDFLWKGPDLIRNLAEILTLFRIHQIALVSDVKEMFHQVLLKPEDRISQTVLYRGMERQKPPEEFQMQVLFFGSKCSPCSAIYTKDKNAQSFKNKYPAAVDAITTQMFVDDFLGGGETEDEVRQLREEMCHIMDSGGLPLVKWNSSSKEVLDAIPEEIRSPTTYVAVDEKADIPKDKALGITWNTQSDQFEFKLDLRRYSSAIVNGHEIPTKRKLVSIVMSVFDPLGFLSPMKMKAQTIIQHLWRCHREIDWDDKIPVELMKTWKDWLKELSTCENIKIPRKLFPVSRKDAESIQLHIFCDSSSVSYAASAYLRIDMGGSIAVSFIMGKARVSPIKGFASIPRGELQAAVIASRLAVFIKTAFLKRLQLDSVTMWTDSRNVLWWIRSLKGKFKPYVCSRVNEILENTNVVDWRWVPTADNVADDGTRPEKEFEATNYRWIKGSDFLLKPENEWPVEKVTPCSSDELEELPAVCTAVQLDEVWWANSNLQWVIPEMGRFSSWSRLVRSTASVLVAKNRFHKSGPQKITTDLIELATMLLVRRTQEECYPMELKNLQKGKPLPESSKLKNLGVFLTKDGIIAIAGRIDQAEFPVRNPPVLDPHHHYTRLLIDYHHRSSGHFGQERLLNELRQRVWTVNARAAVKRCVAKCQVCKLNRAKPQPLLMGQLPLARVDAGKPVFYHTGIDYFGPIFTKNKKATEKRWGVIFSCLTTRAVHLDLAESLDTNEMIHTLTRFINLRGKPAHIWSDNGTNFIGAEREIRESLDEWKQDQIEAHLQTREIQWHFIPPSSPHMGGSWERMIKSVKRILNSLLKEQTPKDGTLRTLFAEVTGILNSRPLTHVSVDANEPEAITPNHLLNVPCVIGATLPGVYDIHTRYQKSWRHVQYLTQQFWDRWRKEYLPTLIRRQKWQVPASPLKVGDLVVVMEDNTSRNHWKLGRITQTFPGKDGQVRSAEVKIVTVSPSDRKLQPKVSYLKRPAVKLFKLLDTGSAPEDAGRKNVEASIEPA